MHLAVQFYKDMYLNSSRLGVHIYQESLYTFLSVKFLQNNNMSSPVIFSRLCSDYLKVGEGFNFYPIICNQLNVDWIVCQV